MNRVLCKNDINLIKVLGDSNCLFNCIIQYIHLDKNIIIIIYKIYNIFI